jgi:tRNA modification GTPase
MQDFCARSEAMSDQVHANSVRLLTPPGTAAIAVVRICGPGVPDFIRRRLSREVRVGKLTHVELRDEQGVIDDPVALRLAEDQIELSLHGGAWIVEEVIRLALHDGFLPVHPECDTVDLRFEQVISTSSIDRLCDDERNFMQRLSEKVEADISIAPTARALSVLLSQPDAWRMRIERWRDAKKNFSSDSCGWEEFKRREIDIIKSDRAMVNLLGVCGSPAVALVGIPNAGKSTLANRLLGREGSIVSPTAGTTRDWVEQQAELDGVRIRLIDTPGLRKTNDMIEAEAIELSQRMTANAQMILLVVDASMNPDGTSDDAIAQRRLIDRYNQEQCVLNKCDLAEDHRLTRWKEILSNRMWVVMSPDRPMTELQGLILSAIGIDGHESSRAMIW